MAETAKKLTHIETPAKILELVKPQLMTPFDVSALPQPSYNCEICKDLERLYFEEESFGKVYKIGKDCVCKLEKIRRKKLSIIPEKFSTATIENIQPKTEIHPKQAEFIPVMKANPRSSFFLAGGYGKGKTYMMWALYRKAAMSDRKTVICSLTELLNEYRAFIQASSDEAKRKYPRISADELRQNHTKYSIFLDDIDKARPTEYAAEQFFELVDAVYAYGHQIVVTTNLSVENLVLHFGRADERFGGSIVRRLTDGAIICEMF